MSQKRLYSSYLKYLCLLLRLWTKNANTNFVAFFSALICVLLCVIVYSAFITDRFNYLFQDASLDLNPLSRQLKQLDTNPSTKFSTVFPIEIRPFLSNDPLMSRCRIRDRTYCLNYFQPTLKRTQFVHIVPMQVNENNPCAYDTDIVVLILSLHSNFENRSAVRNTWMFYHRWPMGSDDSNRTKWINIKTTIAVRFLLGTHRNKTLDDEVARESVLFKDIVKGDFIEDYRNLTLKTLFGLKWVSLYCTNARYVVKSDDDMFLNIPALINAAHRLRQWSVMGFLERQAHVKSHGKWALKAEEYPFSILPTYVNGHAYILTSDVVRPLLELCEHVQLIHLEDVFVTGVLSKMLGVSHRHDRRFSYRFYGIPHVCEVIRGQIVAYTKMTPDLLQKLWYNLQQYQENLCM